MEWSIFKHESEFVSMERVEINDIPCLKVKPKNAEGLLPTVIYYHGWSSNKDFQMFVASIFACYGYQVIAPDAIHHGERGKLNNYDEEMAAKYLWKVILQNVKESKELIDKVITGHNADPYRIGVMGHSMGGFTAAGVFIHNTNIKCQVNINGCCSWLKADEIYRKIGGLAEADTTHIDKLREYDPMKNLDKLSLRPILMLHGDSDTSVPVECQRTFLSEASKLYEDCPERLKLIETPRLDHYKTTNMMERAIEWLKEYL